MLSAATQQQRLLSGWYLVGTGSVPGWWYAEAPDYLPAAALLSGWHRPGTDPVPTLYRPGTDQVPTRYRPGADPVPT